MGHIKYVQTFISTPPEEYLRILLKCKQTEPSLRLICWPTS